MLVVFYSTFLPRSVRSSMPWGGKFVHFFPPPLPGERKQEKRKPGTQGGGSENANLIENFPFMAFIYAWCLSSSDSAGKMCQPAEETERKIDGTWKGGDETTLAEASKKKTFENNGKFLFLYFVIPRDHSPESSLLVQIEALWGGRGGSTSKRGGKHKQSRRQADE